MPPRRRSTATEPLDIDRVRADLAAGKAVRVAIASSAQFPDGASGRVRGLGDPQVVGAEFVEVEVAVNGIRDVIPFAPADLAPPAARRRAAGEPAGPIPAQLVATRSAPGPRAESDRTSRLAAGVPGPETIRAAAPAAPVSPPPPGTGPTTGAMPHRPAASADGSNGTAPRSPAAAPGANGGAPSQPSGSAPALATGGPAAKAGGRRPARAITVLLSTSEAEPTAWRVEARIGAKVALRSTPVSPARAWDLVQSLDNEALSSAVGAVLDQHRQATAARAQALAAELAAVQAELAALPPA